MRVSFPREHREPPSLLSHLAGSLEELSQKAQGQMTMGKELGPG